MGFQVEFERENAVWLSVFRILTSGMGQTDGQMDRPDVLIDMQFQRLCNSSTQNIAASNHLSTWAMLVHCYDIQLPNLYTSHMTTFMNSRIVFFGLFCDFVFYFNSFSLIFVLIHCQLLNKFSDLH